LRRAEIALKSRAVNLLEIAELPLGFPPAGTIADLAASETVAAKGVAEGVQYRSFPVP
jgi:predicted ATPase with chaperone activity